MVTGTWGSPGVPTEDERRFGVRCPRCARTQPPAPRPADRCVHCGSSLPVRRWIAHPPPGLGPARKVTLLRRPYEGPPRYGGSHPQWGFPPVVWRSATLDTSDRSPVPTVRGLRAVAGLAVLTGVACLAAAGAEAWRFALLLAGRTVVLPGGPVLASDTFVLAAGVTALVLGVITAVVAVPVLTTLHGAAARRAGHRPARTPASLVARLVVPGWNLYGAGQVLVEIDRSLRQVDGRRRGSRVTVPLWWLAWVANGLLVLAALIMAFWRSVQWMANTVEMHIAVDLAGAAVAGLLAAVVASFDRAWSGRGTHRYAGWSVPPPASSARNRMAAAVGAAGGPSGDGVDGPSGGAGGSSGDGVGAPGDDDAGGSSGDEGSGLGGDGEGRGSRGEDVGAHGDADPAADEINRPV